MARLRLAVMIGVTDANFWPQGCMAAADTTSDGIAYILSKEGAPELVRT